MERAAIIGIGGKKAAFGRLCGKGFIRLRREVLNLINVVFQCLFGDAQIVCALHVEPQFGACAEGLPYAQGIFGGYRTTPLDDEVERRVSDSSGLCEAVLRDFHRAQKLPEEHAARLWVSWWIGHINPFLMIIFYFYVVCVGGAPVERYPPLPVFILMLQRVRGRRAFQNCLREERGLLTVALLFARGKPRY